MSSPESLDSSSVAEVLPSALWTGRLLMHLRKPENLVTYLVFSAWMKFMGIAAHMPSITVA